MIDTLLSSALNDSKISHEEFTNIITVKNIYENIKDTAELSSLERTTESTSLEHTTESSALEHIVEKSTAELSSLERTAL